MSRERGGQEAGRVAHREVRVGQQVVEVVEKKSFGIPAEHLRKPIDPAILEAFGIAESANQSQLFLAPVIVEGGSYGGGTTWEAGVRSALPGDEETDFGGVQINSRQRISPRSALSVAENWIRESENTKWVQGGAIELPIPPEMELYSFAGLLLVRAGNKETPKEVK
jgi:hypothetical protein